MASWALTTSRKKGDVALMDYRTPKAVTEATIIILKELGIPKQIYTDGEGYFRGKECAALCSRHDINTSSPPEKPIPRRGLLEH